MTAAPHLRVVQGARGALLFTLGLTTTAIAAAPLGWALLVAAGERLRRTGGVVVAALWVTLGALLGLLPTIFPDPGVTDCAGACPANLLGLFDTPSTGTALSRAGVCGGLAEYFNLDPTLIRVLFIVLAVLGGSGVILYIALWIIVPKQT